MRFQTGYQAVTKNSLRYIMYCVEEVECRKATACSEDIGCVKQWFSTGGSGPNSRLRHCYKSVLGKKWHKGCDDQKPKDIHTLNFTLFFWDKEFILFVFRRS